MIKKYGKPTKPQIWAKYKSAVIWLRIAGILASVFSGITEYYKFYNEFEIPNLFLRIISAICLTLLIELALRVTVDKFSEGIFYKSDEKSAVVLTAIFAIGMIAFGYVSTSNSLGGKTLYIQNNVTAPTEKTHDNTLALTIEKKANRMFESDSLHVLDSVNKAFAPTLSGLVKIKNKAKKNIAWLKKTNQYSYDRAKNYIKQRDNAKKAIKTIPNQKAVAFHNGILPYRRKYNSTLAVASDTLQNAIAATAAFNVSAFSDFEFSLSDKQNSYSYVVYFAIILILASSLLKYYAYKESGRELIIIENPIEYSVSPLSKAKEGIRAKGWNGLNGVVDKYLGNEIEINDTGITLKTKPKSTDDTILDDFEFQKDTKDTMESESVVSQDTHKKTHYSKPLIVPKSVHTHTLELVDLESEKKRVRGYVKRIHKGFTDTLFNRLKEDIPKLAEYGYKVTWDDEYKVSTKERIKVGSDAIVSWENDSLIIKYSNHE